MSEKKSKVTILIDKNLERTIRLIQAELIKKNSKYVSFSETADQILRKGIRKKIRGN